MEALAHITGIQSDKGIVIFVPAYETDQRKRQVHAKRGLLTQILQHYPPQKLVKLDINNGHLVAIIGQELVKG